jgi:hypothetical protein
MTRVLVIPNNQRCGSCDLSICIGGNTICSVSGSHRTSGSSCYEGEDLDSFLEDQIPVRELRERVQELLDRVAFLEEHNTV